jgi:hypothetical protein
MNVLVIGGHKHGEWMILPDGAQAWVDIQTATTHRIRKLGWGITRLGEAGMELTGEHYDLRLAVHPDLTTNGPQFEQQVVTSMLQMMAMNAFVREHGEPRTEDATKVPDSPAALFGPDGKPL